MLFYNKNHFSGMLYLQATYVCCEYYVLFSCNKNHFAGLLYLQVIHWLQVLRLAFLLWKPFCRNAIFTCNFFTIASITFCFPAIKTILQECCIYKRVSLCCKFLFCFPAIKTILQERCICKQLTVSCKCYVLLFCNNNKFSGIFIYKQFTCVSATFACLKWNLFCCDTVCEMQCLQQTELTDCCKCLSSSKIILQECCLYN